MAGICMVCNKEIKDGDWATQVVDKDGYEIGMKHPTCHQK